MLSAIKNINLAFTFFLEIGVIVALSFWGFQTGQGTLAKIWLGIGAPILAIVIWGMFGAPKSAWQFQGFWYLVLQILFFGSAILALFATNQIILSAVFALVCVINITLNYLWGNKQAMRKDKILQR